MKSKRMHLATTPSLLTIAKATTSVPTYVSQGVLGMKKFLEVKKIS
jgi:hypothetical protein